MKNLVNATPEEFAAQGYKIAQILDKWFKAVDFSSIKKRNLPKPLQPLGDGATLEEKQKALFTYNEDVKICARKILLESIMAMLGENADATTTILALACFVEPEDKNNHTMAEYLKEITQMLNDSTVGDFFISLHQSGVMSLFAPSRK